MRKEQPDPFWMTVVRKGKGLFLGKGTTQVKRTLLLFIIIWLGWGEGFGQRTPLVREIYDFAEEDTFTAKS